MKTIIENKDGYAVVEWIEKPIRGEWEMLPLWTISIGNWHKKLAFQPSTPVHPDHTQWAKENLYLPVEDDRIEYLPLCHNTIDENKCPCSTEKDIHCRNMTAVPKQPVEVKEEPNYVSIIPVVTKYTPSHALPVEKEGVREIIASFLFRNFSTDLDPIEDMVSARLMADSLICQLPTAPPAEDWVSVEEAMPTESDMFGIIPVLCKDENAEPPYNYPFVAFRHGSRSKDFSLAHESCTNAPVKVTHWKHLHRKKKD